MLRPLALPAAVAALVAAVPAWADNPVELQGVDEETAEQIEAVLPDREAPDSLFAAERLAAEAADRARAWLRAEGYYAAEVAPGADERPHAWVAITPGERFRLAAPATTFLETPPSEDARTAVEGAVSTLRPEAPARSADILAAEQAGLAALRAAGYPDAALGEREVIVDHATRRVSATLRFNAHTPALLGRVTVTPEGVIRDDLAQRMAPWRPGDRYAPELLTRLRRNAAATGAFANVTTELSAQTNADGQRDVTLTLEPLERRTIEIGAGYSTTEGAGVDVEWSRRNAARRAETLTLAGTLAEARQSARAQLAIPNATTLGRTTNYVLQAIREDAGPYDRQALSASWSVDAAPRRQFGQQLGLSYGASISAESYDRAAGVENAYILTTFADIRRDTTDIPLDARNGSLLQARIEPSVSTGDATIPFVRFIGDARIYETPDFADDVTFAARLRVGAVAPVGGESADLPLDRLFYAGGGGSVRGYAYNSIFPENNLLLDEPPGGRGLIEVSAETRWRIGGGWGVVGFIDGGSAFDEWENADMRWGAGLGVRYDLGFAPVRFDIAVPLDARDEDDSFAFYLSIGQAF
ncbi:MAG: autotransporter assembly complex family protein [Hyphomonadaceae bacterium]